MFWLVLPFSRSLEFVSLKLPMLEKVNQTFHFFSGNKTNLDVNSKLAVVP